MRRLRVRARKNHLAVLLSPVLAFAWWTLVAPGVARAVVYGGIDFPGGASSFADDVLTYDPSFSGGGVPTDPKFINPARALGPPDYTGSFDGTGAVALGEGGLLSLAFEDNILTNSGDGSPDLVVFEVGPQPETFFLALRPANVSTAALLAATCVDATAPFGDGYCEIGLAPGSTTSVDVDASFPGFPAGALRFDAVQIIDDPNQGNHTGTAIGADIDAVGAIESGAIQCGDGRAEGAETCDDGGTADGDGCSAGCRVETCWACTGEPSVCSVADGASCDDGDLCTVGDHCDQLTCVGGGPRDCDDGNVCTDDSCDSGSGCAHTPNTLSCDDGSTCSINDVCRDGACVGDAVVLSGCRQPLTGAPLRLRHQSQDSRDSLIWKWKRGEATDLVDFGDPAAGSTTYELCVFDTAPQGGYQLRVGASVAAGGLCRNKPCWKSNAKGFVYTNRDPSSAVRTLRLKAGGDGKAKILIKARGSDLGLANLPLQPRVVVQLRGSDIPACWEADYDLPALNDESRFKANE